LEAVQPVAQGRDVAEYQGYPHPGDEQAPEAQSRQRLSRYVHPAEQKRGRGEVGYSGFKKKNGLKRSILVDGNGIPVSTKTTKANVHDLQSALPTIDDLRIGKQRRRPKRLRADKGYDSARFRRELRKRGIKPAIDHRDYRNRKQKERFYNDRGEIRYGRKRWCVEQRIACLDQNQRLNFLFERTRDAYDAFLTIACMRCYLKVLQSCRK
jgi:hypothetical protein